MYLNNMDWTVILFTFLLVILVSPACIDRVACQQTAANNGTNCRLQRARGIRGRCYVLIEMSVRTNDARALCIRRGGLVPQFGDRTTAADGSRIVPRVNAHPTALETAKFNEVQAFFIQTSRFDNSLIPYSRDPISTSVRLCSGSCPPPQTSEFGVYWEPHREPSNFGTPLMGRSPGRLRVSRFTYVSPELVCEFDFDCTDASLLNCTMDETCAPRDPTRVGDCICAAIYSDDDVIVCTDDCASSPCQNDFACRETLNGFECQCSDTGYTGVLCETNIDECASSPCGGFPDSCIDEITRYACDCTDTDHTGANCEIRMKVNFLFAILKIWSLMTKSL